MDQPLDSDRSETAAMRDPSTPRLAAYQARTQTPLDVLALSTLWMVLARPSLFGEWSTLVWAGRAALSVTYAIDISIRAHLAPKHFSYVRHHPLGLISVIFPPVRVLFSIRLVRSVFRRGHLARFLIAAGLMVLNGAILVYLYERHAPGADITTLGEAVWWSITTVTTVGYGDYSPVTVGGRLIATAIMGIGIMAIAVITAQVSSTFMAQAARRQGRASDPSSGSDGSAGSLASRSTDERLARIEAMLLALGAPDVTAAVRAELAGDPEA